MFNKHKLSTNKFTTAIRDTFVSSHTTDITKEDLELLTNTQENEINHQKELVLFSDEEIKDTIFVNAPIEGLEQNVTINQQQHIPQYLEQNHHIKQLQHLQDNTSDLIKKRVGFDEVEFRSQLTILYTTTQSDFKAEVESLYDLIDAYVNNVSQSLLSIQRNMLREAEELIKEIRENVLEAEEMEKELEVFMEAVRMAYEKAFPRFKIKDRDSDMTV